MSYQGLVEYFDIKHFSGLDTFVSADVRNYYAHKLLTASARSLIQYVYPSLMNLHDLGEMVALPDSDTGHIMIPSLLRNSHIFMGLNGVYLLGVSRLVLLLITGGLSLFFFC